MYQFVVAETSIYLFSKFNLILSLIFFVDTEQPVPVTTKAPHMTGMICLTNT